MQIEYRLMDKLGKLEQVRKRKLERYLQKDNPTTLTTTQLVVLQYIIVESRTRSVFSKDLESFFDIKSSSVNSMVNYLEKAGYIHREPVPEDGRLRKLTVAEKGWEIEDWVCGRIGDFIISTYSKLTQEEQIELERLWDKLLRDF